MELHEDTQKPIRIRDLDEQGRGVGVTEDGQTVFCAGTLPGELALCRIVKRRKSYLEAEPDCLWEPSPYRVTPFCPHAARCGGCALQALDYEAQLRWKRDMVANTLRRIGGIEDCTVLPVWGMEEPRACRAKSAFPFGEQAGKAVPGLYERGSHRLLPLEACPLQHPAADRVLRAVKGWAASHRLLACNETTGKGLLRHLVIRTGFATGQVMAVLVTGGGLPPCTEELWKTLRASVAEQEGFSFDSLWLNFHPERNNTILGGTGKLLHGSETIEERLCGLRFRLSPLSFFQVNPVQAERLYHLAAELCAPEEGSAALDLYCGVGGIALTLASRGARVVGVENVKAAVADAEENARLNGLEGRARFVCADAARWLRGYRGEDGRLAAAVLDPPRKGCDPALLQSLLEHGPERLVYISCKPSTLARDLSVLCGAYRPGPVQPVDMFPHTTHVECCVPLYRR